MDNFDNRNIYPEDDWQSISTPIVKTEVSDSEIINDESEIITKTRKHSKHPVLTLQLTLALCVLLFLFVLKILGTPVYNSVMSWYESEISRSVIYNGDFENFDFSNLFATSDEG